jgi:hypothetical protein
MEKKYPIGGYAPGSYQCHCGTCGGGFIGDKRAYQCEPCAVTDKAKFDALSPEEQQELMKRNAEVINDFFSMKKTTEQNPEANEEKPIRPFKIITKTGEVHEVHKYINNDGEENIWCDEWYGRHVIGQDCEWHTSAPTCAVWVKASDRYPTKDDRYFIRQNDVKSAANLWQSTKEYWQTTSMEWLDEAPEPKDA